MTWTFNADEHALPQGMVRNVGFQFASNHIDSEQLIRDGIWWMVPFAWLRAVSAYGLLIRPGHAIADSPVVRYRGHQAMTVASSARCALPRMLFDEGMNGSPHRLRRMREAWPAVESLLAAAHASMGGAAHTMAAFETALFDEDAPNWTWRSKSESKRAALRALLSRLDPSQERSEYLGLLGHPIPLAGISSIDGLELGRYGAFSTQAAAYLFRRVPEGTLRSQLAATIWRSPAALDLCQVRDDHGLPVGYASATGEMLEAVAVELAAHPVDLTSEEQAAARLLAATSPNDFGRLHHGRRSPFARHTADGFAIEAHLIVIDSVKETDPIRAWNELISAAWWPLFRQGRPHEGLLKLARMLARDAGWDDVAGLL